MKQKLRNSFLKGVTTSLLSALMMYFGLRIWIVTTISIGPVDKLYSLVDTATVLTSILVLVTTTAASYTSGEKLIPWK